MIGTVIHVAGVATLGMLAWAGVRSAWLYFGDRTGLSGRFGKEQDNRRIDWVGARR